MKNRQFIQNVKPGEARALEERFDDLKAASKGTWLERVGVAMTRPLAPERYAVFDEASLSYSEEKQAVGLDRKGIIVGFETDHDPRLIKLYDLCVNRINDYRDGFTLTSLDSDFTTDF